jgi:hypothetical protein
MRLAAWPGITIARGQVVWDGSRFTGSPGSGRFLSCGAPTLLPKQPTGGARTANDLHGSRQGAPAG